MKFKKSKNEKVIDRVEKQAETFADSPEANKNSDKTPKEPQTVIVNFESGKKAILDKIISDAEKNARAVLEDGNQKVDEIIASAAEQSKSYIYKSKSEQEKLAKDIGTRAKTVAELDAKKFLLDAKNALIDETFEKTKNVILNLEDSKYEKLIFGMLEFAEDGDVVTISEREKKIVTMAKLKTFAEKKGIKLSLAKELGNFDGGIMLSQNGVDKNLALETEIAILRDETEERIAKELFKEVR